MGMYVRARKAKTPAVIKAVRERIRRHLLCKQKIVAKEMVVAPCAMSRTIKQNLKSSAYRRCTGL